MIINMVSGPSALSRLSLSQPFRELPANFTAGVDVILLDFSKAFDKVPHRRLLHKLDYYGVRGETLTWIQSFLGRRKQRVLLDGTTSSQTDIISGVPQGTVLGPLLFLAFINDLPECTTIETRLFADDALLFRPIRSAKDEPLLQQDLDSLDQWEERWQMRFNLQKCKVVHICTNKSTKDSLLIHYMDMCLRPWTALST